MVVEKRKYPERHKNVYCPSCNRMVIATEEDLVKGFVCIRCGAKIIKPEHSRYALVVQEEETNKSETKDEHVQDQDGKNSDQPENAEKDETADNAEKTESQGELAEEADNDLGESGDEDEEKNIDSDHAECPGCGFINEIIHKNKVLVQCQSCSKYFQRPHDPDHDPEKTVLPSDKMPNEQHLLLLGELNFAGMPETGRDATNILLIIRDCIEKVIKPIYPSYKFLSSEIRRHIITLFANSPFFSQVYFDGKKMTEEELETIMVLAIPDTEFRQALKLPIKTKIFKEAVKYINEFMQYNFGYPLDRDIPEKLALKAFYRNFGRSLKTYETVTYDESSAHHKIPKPDVIDPKNLEGFYNRKTPAHTHLEQLLNQNGFFTKRQKSSDNLGCASMLLFLASIIFTINYLCHY